MTASGIGDADEHGGRDLTDQRRDDMLRAAADLIAERGFSETRIADVARRVNASPALVIYYFGTKDQLLTSALRHSEDAFYEECARQLEAAATARERLEILVHLTCGPDSEDLPGTWGLWFDLWAQAFRRPAVAKHRVELERRWRTTIAEVVTAAVAAGEIKPVDASRFAATWGALLDGLSIQVALHDEMVGADAAFEIAMTFAEQALALPTMDAATAD
jgi:AcrR family transcriptional regulator